MEKRIVTLSVILLLLFLSPVFADTESLHPANKALMTLYPRPFGFRFPSVPRISATEALSRYKTGEATVIWTGVGGKLVPGGFHYPENILRKLVEDEKLGFLKKKLVILY